MKHEIEALRNIERPYHLPLSYITEPEGNLDIINFSLREALDSVPYYDGTNMSVLSFG
ncbi:hypothetical protein WN48_01695 [Eufriesea mexicana]|uniref:Uncharacterized protein n=1 Tax=Eufriesea mexicana TaxID=516756 RepID=A0A310S7I6_9HYME|nr:hypothetical protein WN48_01695 [Eufriesea mexicana]